MKERRHGKEEEVGEGERKGDEERGRGEREIRERERKYSKTYTVLFPQMTGCGCLIDK